MDLPIYQIIDIETNGLDHKTAEIAEVAVITARGSMLLNIFHKYYGVSIDNPKAFEINKLSIEKLKGWPSLKEPDSVRELRSILNPSYPLFGHNIDNFDGRFLFEAGVIDRTHQFVDTLKLCRSDSFSSRLPNNKLSTWAEALNIPTPTHSALSDVFALYRIISLKGWSTYASTKTC